MTVLSVFGIASMMLSNVLFVLGHKEKAGQAKKAAHVVSTTNRAIRTVRIIMAFTSGVSGLGLTGYDLAKSGCGNDESLRRPPAIVQFVSNMPFADGKEIEVDNENDD